MSRAKNTERVTMSLPTPLLELCDQMAEDEGGDRYDILRRALQKGVVVLQLEQELLRNPGKYQAGLVALANGDASAVERVRDEAGAAVVERVQETKRKRSKNAA